jgi:hypothetical protein
VTVFGLLLTPLFYVLVRKISQRARTKDATLKSHSRTPRSPVVKR